MSFDEARRIYPWLGVGARTEWDRTVASLEDRLDAGMVPEREACRAWNQRGLCVGGGTVKLSGNSAGEVSRTDEANERTLHEAIRRALGEIKSGAVRTPFDWESSLRSTFRGIRKPSAEEWCVGGGDTQAGGASFL